MNTVVKQISLLVFTIIIFQSDAILAQTKFQKIYGGHDIDWARGINNTFDGGFVTTGHTRSAAGDDDVMVIRLDSVGDTLWTSIVGGPDIDQGEKVIQTVDSGFIVGGWTTQGNWNALLIKLNSSGNLQWIKTYGGNQTEGVESICYSRDHGFLIAGSTTTFSTGDFDFYLIKTDSLGNLQWARSYGDIYTETGYSVRQTFDGGYVMVGFTGSFGAGATDILIVKIDSAGYIEWSKTYGDVNYDIGTSIEQTSDSGYIVAGLCDGGASGNSSIFLMKTDVAGNKEWAKKYAGGSPINTGEGYFTVETSDKGFALSGVSYNSGMKLFLLKTDSAGVFKWCKEYGNSSSNSFVETHDKGFVMAGGNNYWDDFIVVKTDSAGNSSCNTNNLVMSESVPNVIVSPWMPNELSGGAEGILSGVNKVKGTAIFDLCPSTIVTEIDKQDLKIYPNPTTGNFTIYFNDEVIDGRIRIYDLLGKIFFEKEIVNEYFVRVNLPGISPSLLFVELVDGNTRLNQKIVVE